MIYVLTGRTLGQDEPGILEAFSNFEKLKEGEEYWSHYGYGEFDYTEIFLDGK